MENTNLSREIFTFEFHLKPRNSTTFNGHNIPKSTSSRYLGLILDQLQNWADHRKIKKILLNSRRKSIYNLIDLTGIKLYSNKN